MVSSGTSRFTARSSYTDWFRASMVRISSGVAERVRECGVDLSDGDFVACDDLLRRVVSFDVSLVDVIHADAAPLDSGITA
jgi:hypothetical protein